MATNTSVRRRVARGVAISALTATALTGALAAPANAAKSPGYRTLSECRAAQTAYGASSFIAITKSCYAYFPQIVGGVWDPNPHYRFNYETRY